MRNFSIVCVALISFATAAQAQQSLFDQTPADPSGSPAAAPAPTGAAPAEAARPKPKPRGPQAARALTIVNASTATVASVEITGESKTVKWEKPLAAQAKAVVKLPRLKACKVSVVATFEGEGQGTPGEVDVCKEKMVRLTD